MGDYDDERQEYIPANRIGRPLQRPLSAHANSRPVPPAAAASLQKASTFGNGTGIGRPRIQSAAQFRNRPSTASHVPAPAAAWGEPSSPRALYGNAAPGLFAGIEPAPLFQRPDHSRPIPSKEPEALEDEVRKLRVALTGFKDQNRMLRTERQRLEEELGRCRTNLVKAEELLNAREKALSPTIGLSQMYRTPETTALVARLKEQVKTLRAEKERFKGDLEELLRSTKATRVAELQSEAHALSQELSRQMEMTAIMRRRMEDAEALAAAAQRKAEAAEALAREYTDAGGSMPPPPARLSPGNTLASGRVRKTMNALQQAHRALLSQASLLRAVFPPGLTMEALAARAALKAPTAGATEVLRYLRHHINKLTTEMAGLPGGRMDPNEDLAAAAAAAAGEPRHAKPPNGRPSRVASGAAPPVPAAEPSADAEAEGEAEAAVGARAAEPSSDPRVLLQGTADLVRELRAMDMDSFMSRPDLEAEVEQLADVAALLIAEHRRLTGAPGAESVLKEQSPDTPEEDVMSTVNPLYQPVPKADPDLVPHEMEEPEAAVEREEEESVRSALIPGSANPGATRKEADEAEAVEEKYEDDFAMDGYGCEYDAPEAAAEGEFDAPEAAAEAESDAPEAAAEAALSESDSVDYSSVVPSAGAVAVAAAEADTEPESAVEPKAEEELVMEPVSDVPGDIAGEDKVSDTPLPLSIEKEGSHVSTHSQRSNGSAPDTPVKQEGVASSVADPAEYGSLRPTPVKQEGVASSVADPAEYGSLRPTPRASTAGSQQPGGARSWQPDGNAVTEEEPRSEKSSSEVATEVALAAGIAVAAGVTAAVLLADGEEKEPSVAQPTTTGTASATGADVEGFGNVGSLADSFGHDYDLSYSASGRVRLEEEPASEAAEEQPAEANKAGAEGQEEPAAKEPVHGAESEVAAEAGDEPEAAAEADGEADEPEAAVEPEAGAEAEASEQPEAEHASQAADSNAPAESKADGQGEDAETSDSHASVDVDEDEDELGAYAAGLTLGGQEEEEEKKEEEAPAAQEEEKEEQGEEPDEEGEQHAGAAVEAEAAEEELPDEEVGTAEEYAAPAEEEPHAESSAAAEEEDAPADEEAQEKPRSSNPASDEAQHSELAPEEEPPAGDDYEEPEAAAEEEAPAESYLPAEPSVVDEGARSAEHDEPVAAEEVAHEEPAPEQEDEAPAAEDEAAVGHEERHSPAAGEHDLPADEDVLLAEETLLPDYARIAPSDEPEAAAPEEDEPEAAAEAETEAEAEPVAAEAGPAAEPEAEPETQPEVDTESEPKTPWWGALPTLAPTVPEPAAEPEPAAAEQASTDDGRASAPEEPTPWWEQTALAYAEPAAEEPASERVTPATHDAATDEPVAAEEEAPASESLHQHEGTPAAEEGEALPSAPVSFGEEPAPAAYEPEITPAASDYDLTPAAAEEEEPPAPATYGEAATAPADEEEPAAPAYGDYSPPAAYEEEPSPAADEDTPTAAEPSPAVDEDEAPASPPAEDEPAPGAAEEPTPAAYGEEPSPDPFVTEPPAEDEFGEPAGEQAPAAAEEEAKAPAAAAEDDWWQHPAGGEDEENALPAEEDTAAQPEAQPEPEAEVEPDAQAYGAVPPASETDAAPEPPTEEAENEDSGAPWAPSVPKPVVEWEPETVAAPDAEAAAGAEPEAAAEPAAEQEEVLAFETEPEVEAEPQAASEPEAAAEQQPEPEEASTPVPEAEQEPIYVDYPELDQEAAPAPPAAEPSPPPAEPDEQEEVLAFDAEPEPSAEPKAAAKPEAEPERQSQPYQAGWGNEPEAALRDELVAAEEAEMEDQLAQELAVDAADAGTDAVPQPKAAASGSAPQAHWEGERSSQGHARDERGAERASEAGGKGAAAQAEVQPFGNSVDDMQPLRSYY